ncbi:hypothetical protein [Homoserinibacter sp. YIM 151385]|uniref:hypothetical protein n=1 Tax=Homoserinibacter sp. YIM 151385 TaxID=2985506 RepID=UPI0022F07239|nr:hypothetical protein [Homoserinibacter sp. YIM 151385]WBU38243.1 hypothetical protein OF852_01275 [Homoserinibacter sp. YIM 151385]
MTAARPLGALAATVLAAAVLAGCGPAATAPEGELEVFRTRFDLGGDTARIAVENTGERAFTIVAAEIDSERFADRMRWSGRATTLEPGDRVDLPVELAAVACPAPTTPVERIRVETRDGGELLADGLGDPYGQIDALVDEACFAREIAALVELEPLGVREPPRAGAPGQLVVRARPTGASGEVRLTGLRSTVLLALDDGAGRVEHLDRDAPLTGPDAVGGFRIPVVPARCDAHALAEDKVGTVMPLELELDGGGMRLLHLRMPDGVRLALYELVAASCGLPDAGG